MTTTATGTLAAPDGAATTLRVGTVPPADPGDPGEVGEVGAGAPDGPGTPSAPGDTGPPAVPDGFPSPASGVESTEAAATPHRDGVPWRFVLASAVGLVVVCVMRAAVQLGWGRVTGLDTGNWLTFGRQWLGDGISGGAGSTYPPVVPVGAVLVESVAGPLGVTVALGAVATLVHGGCLAAVLWRAGCGWWALPVAIAVSSGTAVGEAVAWGGTPQVMGLGLGFLAVYLGAELLVRPRPGPAWVLGGTLLALGATSHLVVAAAAAVGVVMVLLRLTSPLPRPSRARLRRLAGVWGRALVPSLLLVPLYVRLLSTVGDSVADRRDSHSVGDLLHALALASRELPELWRPAMVFCLVLPLVLLAHRREPIWLVTAGLGLVLTAAAAANPEPRFAYLAPLLVAAGVGLLVAHGPRVTVGRLRRAAAAAGVGLMALSAARGLDLFDEQVAYYGQVVPPGTMAALDALHDETTRWDLVAVPPVSGLPYGWWVEGYARRPALVGSSSAWLNFPAERERAAASVRLFSASDVFSDRWFAAAREEGVDVVYVPASFEGVAPEREQSLRRERPDLVLHDSPAALVVEVP